MEAPQVLGTQDAQHIFVEYHRYLPFPFSFIPYEIHALVLPPGGSMAIHWTFLLSLNLPGTVAGWEPRFVSVGPLPDRGY